MASAQVLIVDDSRTSRAKLAAAVRHLGHTPVEAPDGQAALLELAVARFDAILLDIVMPGLSGFDVLQVIKDCPIRREIPVIVISSLEDDMASVVRAIELGAEDFLAKDFDPVLLRARLNACLERKRLRDLEIEYLQQVGRLTRAAEILEKGRFNPSKLGLDEVTARPDALGKLARIFTDMAQQVYERERHLRRNIRTLKGMIALLFLGAIWGLVIPMARIASTQDASPFGMTFWTSLLGSAVCFTIAIARRRLPAWSEIRWSYFVTWAVLGVIVSEPLLFMVTGKVEASTVATILVMEGFLGFAFAAMVGLEQPTFRRLVGLSMGLVGVLVVLLENGPLSAGGSERVWILLALVIPACYAIEGVFLAAKRPANLDFFASLAIMQAIATLLITPVALLTGAFFSLGPAIGGRELSVGIITLATVAANYLYVYLIATTGAVFASQSAYVVTAAGVGWSVLLLGEMLSVSAWLALAILLLGLVLVGPKNEAEPEPIG